MTTPGDIKSMSTSELRELHQKLGDRDAELEPHRGRSAQAEHDYASNHEDYLEALGELHDRAQNGG